jgi:predicted GIY-YIG superfamily endonuclease
MSTTNIYVLSLEGGRYYVGKSHNIYSRYQEHLDGNGSSWTKKYRPVSLVKTLEGVSPFEEDKITKEYMSRYGIDKVRGGSYVEVELSEFQREALKVEIWAAKDLCTNCGRGGHWAKDCYARTDVSGNRIEYEEPARPEVQIRTFVSEKPARTQLQTKASRGGSCYRCGRAGHYSPDCYANTHSKGYSLDSDSDWDYDSD